MNKFKILILIIILVLVIVGVFFLGKSFGKKVDVKQESQVKIQDQAVIIGNQRIVFGDQNAPVVIGGYFDLSKKESVDAYLAITRLMTENKDQDGRHKIFFVYHHYPDINNQVSQKAAEALEAARIMAKFVPMVDIMIAKQDEWLKSAKPQTLFISYAKELGFDENLFIEKLGVVQDTIYGDLTNAKQVGADKSGTIFVNGKQVAEPTYENLKKEVDTIPWPSPTVTPTPIVIPTENPSPTETPTQPQ